MKIIQVVPSFAFGGAETLCENLTYALKACNAEVIVVSLYSEETEITHRLRKNGVDVVFLDKKKGPNFALVFRLAKLLKKIKPDVIHAHLHAMQYAVLASILSGVKIRVHTIHSVAVKTVPKKYRIMARVFYKFCKTTPVAICESIKNAVIGEYGLSDDRVPIVYNGIELSKCMIKEEYAIFGDFTITHVGRFFPPKNHIMLLSAFKKFHEKAPDSKLRLIGDGEKREEIVEFIKNNDLTDCVDLLGWQPQVYEYLQNSDVFTLPSIWEGVPMALIEAMGTGLPIIATRVGAIPSMIQDGVSGILIDNDEEQLAEAFMHLYSNEAIRVRLGKNARIDSDRFSSSKMAEEYLKIYSAH